MRDYCVHELHLSEDAAYKRIQVARAALAFPVIFEALADGRVHLSGLTLLAPHFSRENVDSLLAAATHKSKSEIERLVAERFPTSGSLPLVEAIPSPTCEHSLAPGQVNARIAAAGSSSAPSRPAQSSVRPEAAQSFGLHCAIDLEVRDLLQSAEELLSPAVAPGNYPEILRRALRLLVATERKRKFGVGAKPRRNRRRATDGSHIPMDVRRTVWERDGGQTSPVPETVADAIARAKAMATLEACDDRDVVPWLRALGFRADEIRRAAAFCETVDLALEERVRVAIAYIRPGGAPNSDPAVAAQRACA